MKEKFDQLEPMTPLCVVKELVQRTLMENREGCICPCCFQNAAIYRRPITEAMAKALELIYLEDLKHPGEWVDVMSVISGLRAVGQGGDYGKLKFWGLVVARPGERDDGSTRTGFWAITQDGRDFVLGKRRVQKYALVYSDEFVKFDGELVRFSDVRGKPFDFQEIRS